MPKQKDLYVIAAQTRSIQQAAEPENNMDDVDVDEDENGEVPLNLDIMNAFQGDENEVGDQPSQQQQIQN